MSKKSFKENPALQFINTETGKPTAKGEPEPKVHYIPVETKTRRVQLLFRQSLYNRISSLADEKGLSFNELLHNILEEYADGQERNTQG